MSAASQYCPLGHEPDPVPQPGVGVHAAPGAAQVPAAQTSPIAQQRAGAPQREVPPQSSWHVPSTHARPDGHGRVAEQRNPTPAGPPSSLASGIVAASVLVLTSSRASIGAVMSEGATRSSPPSFGTGGDEQPAATTNVHANNGAMPSFMGGDCTPASRARLRCAKTAPLDTSHAPSADGPA